MIARSITIIAPIVNEWPAPLPIFAILFFSILAIFVTFFLPREDEFVIGEKLKEIKYDIAGKEEEGEHSDLTFHDLN